ncbi:hypothetical protein [Streptomyces microflavus]|uniref:hypothetical protein n=1 Tax=Streptomyces microflavus TaxID=1919 RepID=UPI0037FD12FD
MDATVAGLVGALGGAVLGAAGAWGAALIAFRAARYQADRQADAQQQQWLRQVRRETYRSFIEAAGVCVTDVNTSMVMRSMLIEEHTWQHGQIKLHEAAEHLRQLKSISASLELEADEEIRKKAYQLSRAFEYLITPNAWNPPREGINTLTPKDDERLNQMGELIAEIKKLFRESLVSP